MKRCSIFIPSLILSSMAVPVVAQTSTDNLSVTATVIDNCTVSSAAVDFGDYDPADTNAAAAKDGTGTVTVTCTSGTAATITLNQGANPDSGSTDAAPLRCLTDGTNCLRYDLYQDSSRTTVWGNSAATDLEVTGTGASDARTVYGRILGGQNVPAGSYSDTVQVTVSF